MRRRPDARSCLYGGFGLLVLGITGCIAIVAYEVRPGEAVPSAKPAPTPQPPVWARYTTPDGRCSAEFPEEPRVFECSLRLDPFGRAYLLFSHDTPPDLDGAPPESVLDLLRDAYIANDGITANELIEERRVVVDGHAGREWLFRNQHGATTRQKMVVGAGRISLAAVITMLPEDDKEAMNRFINSFRFE
jgi:hypothetical protein